MADIEGGTPPMVVVRRILWVLVAVAAVFGVILAVGGGDGSKSAPAASTSSVSTTAPTWPGFRDPPPARLIGPRGAA